MEVSFLSTVLRNMGMAAALRVWAAGAGGAAGAGALFAAPHLKDDDERHRSGDHSRHKHRRQVL